MIECRTTNERRRDRAGFTLMELLVVIGVIAILAAILLPAINTALGKADEALAKAEVKEIFTAVQAYFNEYGKLPVSGGSDVVADGTKSKEIIKALIGEDDDLNPRRLSFLQSQNAVADGTFEDPWGTQYVIGLDGDYDGGIDYQSKKRKVNALVVSYGANTSQDNPSSKDSDDILSFEK